jgi:hypothetical protein
MNLDDEESQRFFAEPVLGGPRFFAEFTLSGVRFFATLRMTGSEGLRMTRSEGLKMTRSEGLKMTSGCYYAISNSNDQKMRFLNLETIIWNLSIGGQID